MGSRAAAAVVLLLALAAPPALAAEIAGVPVQEKARVGASELVLNGAGVRTRIVFKVYVGALYLPRKTSSASEALAEKGPKRVSMTLLRDLTAEQLVEALEDGIRRNHGEAEVAALKDRMDALAGVMREIGRAREGSVVALDYLPGAGTRVTVDGVEKGAAIAGEDFYAALLRIWLGDKPVDGSLKRAMLGQGG
jgi:chalcone isomerase-like protein